MQNPIDTSDSDLARDVAAISRISAVPALLRIICQHTGMGFAAVARVTAESWTACAVQDDIQFGLKPGGQLDVNTTLCVESRAARTPIVFDHASQDPAYCNHHTPRLYKIESYISVPIILPDGDYFGNLCAIDPKPAKVSDARTVAMFTAFAELIAQLLVSEGRQEATENELRDARANADLRDQFIAVLGHDLRNPLGVASMTAEILVRNTESPAINKLGVRLRAASRRMSDLINDVLDFARGRMGAGMGLKRAMVADLDAALEDVVSELRDAHPAHQVVSRIDITAPVYCDRPRIQQLLSNLLGNALAYGAKDQPVIVTAGIQGHEFVMSVLNGGRPIEARNLAHLFEPYWRAGADQSRSGLGLGLYICSEIIRAHEGRIDVRSCAEEGTCFTARVPARAPEPATA